MNKSNRHTETHITPVSNVIRDAMPLLCSVVHGETFGAEALNMTTLGIINAGLLCGYDTVPNGGMNILIRRDRELEYSAGIVQIGKLQHFNVIQQLDIEMTLLTGSKWFIVIEVYYAPGETTRQVNANADHDAAKVRAILEHEVTKEHQVICEVDLTGSPDQINAGHITTEYRIDNGGIDLGIHNADPDAHPGLVPRVNYIDTIDDKLDIGRINIFRAAMTYEMPYIPSEDGFVTLAVHPNVNVSQDKVILTCEGGRKFRVGERYLDTVTFNTNNRSIPFYTGPNGWWFADDINVVGENINLIPFFPDTSVSTLECSRTNYILESGKYQLEDLETIINLEVSVRVDMDDLSEDNPVFILPPDGKTVTRGKEVYDKILIVEPYTEFKFYRRNGEWFA